MGSHRTTTAHELTPEARAVVVGSLLGDAYVSRNGTLQIEHKLDHMEYVEWKREKLKAIAGEAPKIVERYDSRTGKTYRSIRFYTKAVLKEFRVAFYRDRKKVVPRNIGDLLDPLAVAVWFMDDGSRGAHTPRGLVINTSCFSHEEQLLLRDVMAEKFGVQVSIHKVGRGFQLYVRARTFGQFSEVIGPHLVANMRYKLPVDPVTTSPPRRRDGRLARESNLRLS